MTLAGLAMLMVMGCSDDSDSPPLGGEQESSSSGVDMMTGTATAVEASDEGASGSSDGTTGTAGAESSSDSTGGDEASVLPEPEDFTFIGEHAIAGGSLIINENPVGGLSGLTYLSGNTYLAISDAPPEGNTGPARFYTLTIDLTSDQLGDESVNVMTETLVQGEGGEPIDDVGVDLEGIASLASGEVYISSEGDAVLEGPSLVAPWIRRFNADGSYVAELPMNTKYTPIVADGVQTAGVLENLSLEALTVAPGEGYLIVGNESAIVQDGPEADLETGAPSRLIRYDLGTGQVDAEFIYVIDPVADAPDPSDAFRVTGLVELLALDAEGEQLLALERSFSVGVGNAVKLYAVDLRNATDVSDVSSVSDVGLETLSVAEKRLLIDFNQLTLSNPLDNIEGMAFGPDLSDGRASLIFVSDDNFSDAQVTQFIAFAVDRDEEPSP